MFALLVVADKGWATAPKPGQVSVVPQPKSRSPPAFTTVASAKMMPTHKMPFNYHDWLVPWWISTLVCSPVTCWHFIQLNPDNTWIATCSCLPLAFQAPANLQSCKAARCFGNTLNQLPKPAKIPMAHIAMLLLPFSSRIRQTTPPTSFLVWNIGSKCACITVISSIHFI